MRDPMFKHPEFGHEELIRWTLEKMPPANPPGIAYAYSNFGYCLLGRVIEKMQRAVPMRSSSGRMCSHPAERRDGG